MTTRSHASLAVAVALALVAGVATSGEAQSFRLRRMVVVGDSLLAGFGSGGFVAGSQVGQSNSAPALVARRARVTLPQPLMSSPGVPPPLRIVDANRNGVLDAGDVGGRGKGIGFRDRPRRAVRNLAVPGESLGSVFDTIDGGDLFDQVTNDEVEGRDLLKYLILGLPSRSSAVSQLTRARDLSPSFIMVWLGNNDVLDMATQTNPAAADMTVVQFGTQYRRFLNELADLNAPMVVANLPDVTQIALLRRAASEVTSCTLDGVVQPVDPDSLLSIQLDRSQLPQPPCRRVLDATERAQIRDTVTAFNAEIAGAVADVQAARGIEIATVDMFTLFDGIAGAGADVRGDGSLIIRTGYLGGLFSLDGVHPTRTGQALIANAFIDAINTRFGEGIPRADVARIAANDPLVNNRFRPAGEPPFGLIADEDADVEDAFAGAFETLEKRAGSVFEDLADRIGGIFDDIEDFFDGIF